MAEFDPSKINMFLPRHTAQFNACVGENSFHDARTYATGYIEAANLLVSGIIENELYSKRDTLVHPILYSARHSIELMIKHFFCRLEEEKIVVGKNDFKTHSLRTLWEEFISRLRIDRRFIVVTKAIDPIVLQLAQADPDAQDFRYPISSDGDQTLSGKAIVDLISVKELLVYLQEKIIDLFELLEMIIVERNVNAYTSELNRPELEQLPLELPPIYEWKNPKFGEIKKAWKIKYGLSNSAFSRAIDFIKAHREFSGNIENGHQLIALGDDFVQKIILAAKKMNLENAEGRKEQLSLESLMKPDPSYGIYETLEGELSLEKIADVNALFYLARDGYLSESYQMLHDMHMRELEVAKEWRYVFVHVFSKTNFVEEMMNALGKVGRKSLLQKIESAIERLVLDLKLGT